ncbi:MAG: hypothetical protein D6746_01090 [Bacteroidetes bacterium]|nr:MAG: hypothetical protein D6746_01090 [Bacteroidota bacterium]
MGFEVIFSDKNKKSNFGYRRRHKIVDGIQRTRGRFMSVGMMFDGLRRGFLPVIEVSRGVLDAFWSDYRAILDGPKGRYLHPDNVVFEGVLYLACIRLGDGAHGFLMRPHKRGLSMNGTLRLDSRVLGLDDGSEGGIFRKYDRKYLYRFRSERLGTYLEGHYRTDPDTYAVLLFLSEPRVTDGEIIYRVNGVSELVSRGGDDQYARAIRENRVVVDDGDDFFIDLDKGIIL